jgi:hypothetical protein
MQPMQGALSSHILKRPNFDDSELLIQEHAHLNDRPIMKSGDDRLTTIHALIALLGQFLLCSGML